MASLHNVCRPSVLKSIVVDVTSRHWSGISVVNVVLGQIANNNYLIPKKSAVINILDLVK